MPARPAALVIPGARPQGRPVTGSARAWRAGGSGSSRARREIDRAGGLRWLLAVPALLAAACTDETALVAQLDGLPTDRTAVSVCLTARRGDRVVFARGYGAGHDDPLPGGEVTLTFVPDEPSGPELVLVADATQAARPLGRGVTRAAFREGRSDRVHVPLEGCRASPAGPLVTLATRDGGGLAAGVAVADVDADGRADLVGTDEGGALVRQSATSGEAIAGPELEAPLRAAHVAVLDLDGDCAPELALSASELVVAPIAQFDPDRVVRRLALAATALASGDLDGDGRAELLAASGDAVTVLASDGAQGLRRLTDVPTGPVEHLAAGDLDGDGRVELLATGPAGTRLFRGGVPARERPDALPPALAAVDGVVELGDLDGDRALDAVGVTRDGALVIARNRGDGLLEDLSVEALRGLTLDFIALDVALADVTGDCVVDVVVAIDGGAPLVLRGRPDGGLELGPTIDGVQCREVFALDADADGRAEIGAITASGRVALIGAAP